MKIFYNAYTLNKPITGVGRYLQSLSFLNSSNLIKIGLVPNKDIHWSHGFDNLLQKNYKSKFFKLLWNYFHVFLIREKVHLYHSPFPSLPFFCSIKAKKIITIHDLIFLENSNWYSWKESLIVRLSLKHAIKNTNCVICVSEYTKDQLLKYFPNYKKRIFVVHNPIFNSYNFNTEILKNTILVDLHNTKQKYFVLPSNWHPRKNILNTILAFEKSKYKEHGYKLILCGHNESNDIISFNNSIIDIKYLSDFEYNELQTKSQGIFYFSEKEGFGYPVIEAIEKGIPIFCSNIPSTIELLGIHHDIFCNDISEIGICNFLDDCFYNKNKINKILRVLESNKEKFNYNTFQKKMMDIYNEILNN
jgi:glycosyltransferase involved in cell wall biosynthesis